MNEFKKIVSTHLKEGTLIKAAKENNHYPYLEMILQAEELSDISEIIVFLKMVNSVEKNIKRKKETERFLKSLKDFHRKVALSLTKNN